jgi:hypothetical protein
MVGLVATFCHAAAYASATNDNQRNKSQQALELMLSDWLLLVHRVQ